ncbi:uncharacterized protein LOC103713286 isoform X2 [Phoenix dactylifera]|uniref:Uncharacterized protein LOC103713286 isoform X2 n=1 Tax=Phoenix dactylifera TaxID=42345 RepID=A0A8B8J7V1_PHODC|nr:uncharacterized protein LOC103713286 isoform X2 [Phoenix dactylifera]
MEHLKENGWKAIPQFGGWDQKAGGATNYSMVFSQARANRKQNKTELKRPGYEEDLMAYQRYQRYEDGSVTPTQKRKKVLRYCCIVA